MKILFKYTSRSRPENFKRGLKSIIDNCERDNYKILVSLDDDDITMEGYASTECEIIYGRSKSKIFAINRDVNESNYDFDVLVNMSDDMVFTQKGFDNIIRREFKNFHSDTCNLDLCLHFPDGNTEDKLMTMSIMGRAYYDRTKYIYNPSYISLWADNEAMEVAKILGCYKFVNHNMFLHLHPAFGKAHNDEQYILTESYYRLDEQTYLKRKEINFGL